MRLPWIGRVDSLSAHLSFYPDNPRGQTSSTPQLAKVSRLKWVPLRRNIMCNEQPQRGVSTIAQANGLG